MDQNPPPPAGWVEIMPLPYSLIQFTEEQEAIFREIVASEDFPQEATAPVPMQEAAEDPSHPQQSGLSSELQDDDDKNSLFDEDQADDDKNSLFDEEEDDNKSLFEEDIPQEATASVPAMEAAEAPSQPQQSGYPAAPSIDDLVMARFLDDNDDDLFGEGEASSPSPAPVPAPRPFLALPKMPAPTVASSATPAAPEQPTRQGGLALPTKMPVLTATPAPAPAAPEQPARPRCLGLALPNMSRPVKAPEPVPAAPRAPSPEIEFIGGLPTPIDLTEEPEAASPAPEKTGGKRKRKAESDEETRKKQKPLTDLEKARENAKTQTADSAAYAALGGKALKSWMKVDLSGFQNRYARAPAEPKRPRTATSPPADSVVDLTNEEVVDLTAEDGLPPQESKVEFLTFAERISDFHAAAMRPDTPPQAAPLPLAPMPAMARPAVPTQAPVIAPPVPTPSKKERRENHRKAEAIRLEQETLWRQCLAHHGETPAMVRAQEKRDKKAAKAREARARNW